MAPRSCINAECGTTTTEDWRNGWALRSGGFANLCGNCGMAYEQSIFCDVFHGEESGWRECSCCGKRLHCGCVASRSFIVLLDNGGVQCINCAKTSDLSPPLEKGEDSPNQFVTSTAGRSIDYQVQSTMINGSFKQMKCEEVMLSIGDSSSQPWREKKSFSPLIPGFLGIGETDDYVGNSRVSLSMSNLGGERKEQVHKGQQNHPKSLKSTLLRSSEMSKECISHLRIARPPVDGRGRNHLLPRYWPRITDQELKQISGDSNSTIVPLFEKVLSASDAGRIGRLVLPKACAEAYFPPISQPEGLPLRIQDAKGKDWIFQFRFWPNNNSRMYVLEGVTPCIQSMQLRAGDIVTFSRIDPGGKLVMGFRKSTSSTSLQDSQVFTINGDETFLSNLHLPFLQPEKKRSRNISSKRKRLLIDSEESLELKLSWEEAQDLLRAPPNATPSIVVIEDHEFEEYEEPPILGKRTIFTIRSSGGDDQWVQCDNCGKWRRLPAGAVVLSKWVCQDNVWDSERSSCFAPDEIGEREIHDLLLLSAELRKQKLSKSSAHPSEPASPETLATLAVMGPAAATSATTDAAATTTRHPRHRPGCSCIVCIQPPSGKGPKHKPNCSCNVCLTVRRRFKTLMLRKKKRQSEQQAQQEAHFPLHQSELISPDPTAQIDLNSCPDRGTMMSLLQVASLPLENYLKENGLSSLASDHHASSSSATHLAAPPTAADATSGSPENS